MGFWWFYLDWNGARDYTRRKEKNENSIFYKGFGGGAYPPDGMDDAVETVMTQCELWTDNTDMEEQKGMVYSFNQNDNVMAAEEVTSYGQRI